MDEQEPEQIEALRRAGLPIDDLTDNQRSTLASLTPQEVAVLLDVQRRLLQAGPEVVAHLMVGGLFY